MAKLPVFRILQLKESNFNNQTRGKVDGLYMPIVGAYEGNSRKNYFAIWSKSNSEGGSVICWDNGKFFSNISSGISDPKLPATFWRELDYGSLLSKLEHSYKPEGSGLVTVSGEDAINQITTLLPRKALEAITRMMFRLLRKAIDGEFQYDVHVYETRGESGGTLRPIKEHPRPSLEPLRAGIKKYFDWVNANLERKKSWECNKRKAQSQLEGSPRKRSRVDSHEEGDNEEIKSENESLAGANQEDMDEQMPDRLEENQEGGSENESLAGANQEDMDEEMADGSEENRDETSHPDTGRNDPEQQYEIVVENSGSDDGNGVIGNAADVDMDTGEEETVLGPGSTTGAEHLDARNVDILLTSPSTVNTSIKDPTVDAKMHAVAAESNLATGPEHVASTGGTASGYSHGGGQNVNDTIDPNPSFASTNDENVTRKGMDTKLKEPLPKSRQPGEASNSTPRVSSSASQSGERVQLPDLGPLIQAFSALPDDTTGQELETMMLRWGRSMGDDWWGYVACTSVRWWGYTAKQCLEMATRVNQRYGGYKKIE